MTRQRGYVGLWALVAVAVLALGGCGGGGGSRGSEPVRFTTQPALTTGPNPEAALVRVVTADSNVPTRLEIAVAEQNGEPFTVASNQLATNHVQPIIGLRPGRSYDITVAAVDAHGGRVAADQALHVTTDSLPAGFPQLDVHIAESAAMEPGFTLFGTRRKDGMAGFLVIVDRQGEVIWFLPIATSSVVRQLSNGNLITILANRMLLLEIDLLGRTVRTWYAARSTVTPPAGAIPVDVFTFHNEIVEIGAASFLTASDIVRFVDDFPTNENDPTVRTNMVPVLDEPIVEFAADGTTVRTWNFLDLLKPTRIGYDSTLGLPDAADWAHTNAAIVDARDDSIIASLRHQDAVVKVSRGDGTLRWILSPPDNWQGFEPFLLTPVGEPFGYAYHQHAPQLTARGTLLLFDNGNRRASPFTGQPIVAAKDNHSRAVEYAIDEQAHTVRQVWEFVHPEQLYAPFVGSAYELPATGNVLIAYGGLCTVNGVNSDDILHCRGRARLIEVRRVAPESVVFDLEVRDPDPSALGWLVYRGHRIPSLGPPSGG